MIIPHATAMFVTPAAGKLLSERQTITPIAEKTADTTTISKAAQDLLTSEKARDINLNSTGTYRVEAPVYSLEDIAKSKDRPLFAVKMTEDQINEVKLRAQQEQAREVANFNYANAHQYQPVGQVVVNRKLVATVTDAGSYESSYAIPNLSQQYLSPADRLAEIARAVHGEIIYSNFMPTMGGWIGAAAPESELPPLTARSLMEILKHDIGPAMEKKIAEWEAQTGKTSPRIA